ncbi:hypothetical protein BOTBODRAFT_149409 [Botryobasidium botryosum FD-172 SS1]|uniref:Sacsin/Nov domain-containing protein n=1 Tax=Botryobasidium botryosum (strain FD-172 SS1) TaxID=930990 RepID=A0A067M558_BOTB1|nr:hypothetical protein BOTBODRAFT_149409 [Botryobasidium botryosum FD-172 SS1]
MLLRANKDPEISDTIQALRANVARALTCLSIDLYSKSTHFLLEFIQNADDNSYDSNVEPTLRLALEDQQMCIQCNEKGFSAADVEAICRIGTSTKINSRDCIGEKGIGFKSVFEVADVVYIASGKYTFKFDKREELGVITPRWTNMYPVRPGWTSFYLQLKDGEKLTTQLRDIEPTILLFLRKLRSMAIEMTPTDSPDKIVEFHRHDIDSNLIKLDKIEDTETCSQTYFVLRHMAQTYQEEERRKNIKESEIVLAFPIPSDEGQSMGTQSVYAFLPLRSYGFRFIIHADFLTASSREDILSNLDWNISLLKGIEDAFMEAVEPIMHHPALENIWFRFIPESISNPYFSPLVGRILNRLRSLPIIRSSDGVYRLASQIITVPSEFRDDSGQPLIPEEFLPQGFHYLWPSYGIFNFARLGVNLMSPSQFLAGLRNMKDLIPRQPESWHIAVCNHLYAHRNSSQRSIIRQLPILPLSTGPWVSADSSDDIYFHSELAEIPSDLGLHLLANVKMNPSRYALFEAIGVKTAKPQVIANKICEAHQTLRFSRTIETLTRHVRFLFTYHTSYNHRLVGFRVMDEHGQIVEATEAYLDVPGDARSIKMRDIMPSPVPFLHPDYLGTEEGYQQTAWISWLRDTLGVNTIPRLIEGRLSPEFEELTKTLEPRKLLATLKECWQQLKERKITPAAISRLSDAIMGCEDGTRHEIKNTSLKRNSLRPYSYLHFLPVLDPENADWDFLSQLGVTLRVDSSFFLKRLVQLSKDARGDIEVVRELYKQLDARFDDDPSGIRAAFRSHPLLLLPDGAAASRSYKWLSVSDAVWSGPLSMTSKTAIKNSYPALESFFHEKLEIYNAPRHILAIELKALAKEWAGKPIPDMIQGQVLRKLVDLSDVIGESACSECPEWLLELCDEAIFPTTSSSQELNLRAPSDRFYVPDKSGKFHKVFDNRVPILAFPPTLIQPLLDLNAFRSRMRFLDSAVDCTSTTNGSNALDSSITTKYVSRAEYIKRMVHAKHPTPAPEVLKHLAKLTSLAILTVDSIDTTYRLEDITVAVAENLIIEHGPTDLNIVLSKKCPAAQRDLAICAELAILLEVKINDLLLIVSQPLEVIEVCLAGLGITEVRMPDTLRDRSWLRGEETAGGA